MTDEKLCIFYTEDDPDDQQIFTDALKSIDSSLELHVQNDGVELLTKLDNPPPKPSLLFLDLNMPKKNGIQVLEELQASKKIDRLKVIVFTTSDDDKSIEMTKNLGASLFITKPQSYQHFISAIRHCLAIDWKSFSMVNNPFVLSFK